MPGPTPELNAWQRQAYEAWVAADWRGLVEAVPGTSKDRIALAAIDTAARATLRTLIVTPDAQLVAPWLAALAEHLPQLRVGHVDGDRVIEVGADVVVADVGAAAVSSDPWLEDVGLVVAEECQRYESATFARALRPGFGARLGLTTTAEPSATDPSDGRLAQYFGPIVHRYPYAEAATDGLIAPFDLELIGVELTEPEQVAYDELTARLDVFRDALRSGLNDHESELDQIMRLARGNRFDRVTKSARGYLALRPRRLALLAECSGKVAALPLLIPMLLGGRTLVFTEAVEAAEDAAERLGDAGLRSAVLSPGPPGRGRRDVAAEFAAGHLDVLCAPHSIGAGVEVPEADIALVLTESSTRREMALRMSRVLRLDPDGHTARFVIVYALGTSEDPDAGAHDGFADLSSVLTPSASRWILSRDGGGQVGPRIIIGRPIPDPADVPTRAATVPAPVPTAVPSLTPSPALTPSAGRRPGAHRRARPA